MSDKYPGGFVTANAPAGFSVAFDGTGDYLNLPASSTPLQFGTGDFTVEFWVYPTNLGSNSSGQQIVFVSQGASSFACSLWTGNVHTAKADVADLFDFASTAVINNSWFHVAIARASGSTKCFVNGVQAGTTQSDTNNFSGTGVGSIGANYGGGLPLYGYMSNVRILKGTALYTTTFTPPTQLFPITNTSLLTCQSPTIIDNSTNNFTVTANGDAKVSNFTPFAGYTGFNPALGAAAGGVWTIDEAAYYQQNRLWPIYDPYFNQTTLMLHGNGTNAAQNNTFLDSSVNNFTITRNGNSTQGSFTPFSQTGWSTYFDASSNSLLSLPANTAFAFDTGAYTIEAWVFQTKRSVGDALIFSSNTNASGDSFIGYVKNTGALSIEKAFVGAVLTSAANTVPLNTWCHVAFVRTSTATNGTTIYLNGVAVAVGTDSNNWSGYGAPGIGKEGSVDYAMIGYMSNVRIVKGNAVYTSNFTPSTAPLNVVTGTSLLTCQGNRFVDASANNFTVTSAGAPSVQAFSPFVPAYITPTTYSNYFNGSSSYLYVVSSALNVPSSTDFTIEGWVYLNAHTNNQPCIFNNYTSGGGLALFAGHNSFDANLFNLLIAGNIYSGGTIVYGKWTHFAVVRNGTGSGNVSLYINGISVLSTISTNAAITYTGQVSIGTAGDSTSAGAINGCISNFRWNTTTAVYTASFTPPTAPLTAISGTQLLTCQSSTFIDNSTNNLTLTAAGTVQPVTSPTPFPANVDTTTLNSAYSTSLIGGSYYGNASGDYLNFTDSSNLLDMGSTAASFECWYYMTTTGSYQNIFTKWGGTAGWNATSGIYYAFAVNNGVPVLSYSQGPGSFATITDPTTRTVNQWYHLAIATDTSNNISMYVNGVRVANTTSTIAQPPNRTLMQVGSLGTDYVRGYLSGARFLTGANAYKAASLNIGYPPLTPPTAISGTQLLLNFTNGAIFDNTAKNVLETVGNAQISTTQSKWGGSSMYFNGSTGYLKPYYPASTNGTNYSFGTGDFTLEFWMYPTSTPAAGMLMDGRGSGASGDMWLLNFNSGVANWYVAGNLITSSAISANTWTHLAVCKAGGSTRMFLNGVQTGSTYADSKNYTVGNGWPTIGASYNAVDFFAGYLDDLRITKGVARYKANFTPPTSQLQDQ